MGTVHNKLELAKMRRELMPALEWERGAKEKASGWNSTERAVRNSGVPHRFALV